MIHQQSTGKNAFDGSLQTKGAFVASTGLARVGTQIQSAARRFFDSETGAVDRALTAARSCLVCGTSDAKRLFDKNGFPHVRCVNCGFLYVTPALRSDVLDAYYRTSSSEWKNVTDSAEYNEYHQRYYQFHLDNIDKFGSPASRTILDVGCNNGQFLIAARERGWSGVGLDMSADAIAAARAKGLEVLEGPLTIARLEGRRFGAVSMLGVLEHLLDPVGYLRIIRSAMHQDGVLVLLVPNADSLSIRIMREHCGTFDGIEHLSFWNSTTLARFLHQHGFEVVHAETTISELYSIDSYLNFESPGARLSPSTLLLDVLTPEYIHQHMLGHHLCAYARPI